MIAKPLTRAIYAAVRAIPRGKVATYGELASLAGLARGHRIVAKAMRACPRGLPWHRVVGKKDARRAKIAIEERAHARKQRALLEREGVVFDKSGGISLRDYGWRLDGEQPQPVKTRLRPDSFAR